MSALHGIELLLLFAIFFELTNKARQINQGAVCYFCGTKDGTHTDECPWKKS